jgi:hypothetical protein
MPTTVRRLADCKPRTQSSRTPTSASQSIAPPVTELQVSRREILLLSSIIVRCRNDENPGCELH